MIETPIALLVIAAAAIGTLAALARRRPDHVADAERTRQLTQKLSDAAREADEHIAAYANTERKRGDHHG